MFIFLGTCYSHSHCYYVLVVFLFLPLVPLSLRRRFLHMEMVRATEMAPPSDLPLLGGYVSFLILAAGPLHNIYCMRYVYCIHQSPHTCIADNRHFCKKEGMFVFSEKGKNSFPRRPTCLLFGVSLKSKFLLHIAPTVHVSNHSCARL